MKEVYVADNASVIAFVLQRVLQDKGFSIQHTKHPRDLIDLVTRKIPQVIFLEAEIAGGQGLRICEFLSRRPDLKHIPVILTTRITDMAKHRFDSWPCVRKVLRKPLSHDRVIAALDEIGLMAEQVDLDSSKPQSKAV